MNRTSTWIDPFDIAEDIINHSHRKDEIENEDDKFERYSIMHDEFGKGNVGIMQTYFNSYKCFVGIGILALPAAFHQVGFVAGSIGVTIVGVINLYTMHLMLVCQQKYGADITCYSELGYAVFGVWGKAFVDMCICISQIGFCVAYLLFIGN